MYFPFFILHQRNKRSAIHPQTIYSEVPLSSCVKEPPNSFGIRGLKFIIVAKQYRNLRRKYSLASEIYHSVKG